jgi:hypothetical protein
MRRVLAAALVLSTVVPGNAWAQAGARGARGRGAQPPPSPQAGGSFDPTGYWVAVVTQDWRFRMAIPPKGDVAGLPVNDAARKIAGNWDPARDEAAGEQCRAYGAPNIMRIPGRLHITWKDDHTLQVDTDSGRQTRVFAFEGGAGAATGATEWQGTSKATWEQLPGRRGQMPLTTSLRVVTSGMKPGYLRRNGVPYSARATMTEYFDRIARPNGDSYLIVTTTIDDPEYLTQPYLYSTHFKRQADATGWNPRPCSVN